MKIGDRSNFDAKMIGLHSFYSHDDKFSLDFQLPYFMLLRRPARNAEEDVSLRFNLIDLDGNPIGEPRNVKALGKFPSGFMFMTLHGTIAFSFPRIGDYRLDITADEDTMPFLYQYDIEVTENPER